MSIGIFIIDIISKESNVGVNVIGRRENIIGLVSIYSYHIVIKTGGFYLSAFEAFIQM